MIKISEASIEEKLLSLAELDNKYFGNTPYDTEEVWKFRLNIKNIGQTVIGYKVVA